ncbi:MAG: hypothetical protein RIQ88_539 [Actinomycetota bacterium]
MSGIDPAPESGESDSKSDAGKVFPAEIETKTDDALEVIENQNAVNSKSKINLLQVFGEIFLTLGLILALFVGYKAVIQDSVVSNEQQELATTYKSKPSRFKEFSDVKKQGDVFAQLYIPRFGDNWTRLVGEGTRWHPTLNTIGVGHYLGSAWPGRVGNFAVAAHRGGFGGAFKEIHRLVEGDKVYVRTKDYWFVYKFLQSKIVDPTEIQLVGAKPGGRYMTMTSCTPIFVNTQRYIVWLELLSTSKKAPAGLKIHGGD